MYFDSFLAKIWIKYYQKSTMRPYLESSHQGQPLRPQCKSGIKIYFFGFPSIFKILSLVRELKSSFYGRMTLFCYSHHMAQDWLRKPGKSLVRCKMKHPNAHELSIYFIYLFIYLFILIANRYTSTKRRSRELKTSNTTNTDTNSTR